MALRASGLGIALLVLLVLGGCGEGEDQINAIGVASGGPTVVQGGSMLGAVAGARVTAVELDANGRELRLLVRTTTDAEGAYHFTVGPEYSGGPILLKLDGGAGVTTLCDVPDGCGEGYAWGDPVPLGPLFRMLALVPPVAAGATVNAQITPFTHMAAARARANPGGVSEAVVRAANSEASRIVGVDVLRTPPENLLHPGVEMTPEGRVYAAFISAASAWMVQNGGFEAGLTALADMFRDGTFTDVDGDYVFIQALLTYLRTEGDQLFVEEAAPADAGSAPETEAPPETPPEVAHAVVVLEGASGCAVPGACSFDPVPPPEVVLTDPAVERAKALVRELRGWFLTLADLKDPLKPLAAELSTSAAVFDANSAALLDGLGKAVMAVFDDLSDRASDGLAYDREYTAAVRDGSGQLLGHVHYMLKNNSGTLALALYGSDIPGLDLDLLLDPGLSSLTLYTWTIRDLDDVVIGVNGTLANDAAAIELINLGLVLHLEEPFEFNPIFANSPPDPVVVGMRVDGGFALTTASASFRGSAGFELVPLLTPADGSSNTLSLRWSRLKGLFEPAGESAFSASMELFVNNAAEFDTLAYLASGSPDFESDTYFARAVLSVAAELDLVGHTAANATVTVNRTGSLLDGALMTLSYEGQSLTFDIAQPDAHTTRLGVSTPEGVAFDLTQSGDQASGSLFVDGVEVGVITTRDNGVVIIRYQDGSFESLQ